MRISHRDMGARTTFSGGRGHKKSHQRRKIKPNYTYYYFKSYQISVKNKSRGATVPPCPSLRAPIHRDLQLYFGGVFFRRRGREKLREIGELQSRFAAGERELSRLVIREITKFVVLQRTKLVGQKYGNAEALKILSEAASGLPVRRAGFH